MIKYSFFILIWLLYACASADERYNIKEYRHASNKILSNSRLSMLKEEVARQNIPLFSISIITQGSLVATYLIGKDDLSNYSDITLFQAGSLSKLVSSCTMLALSKRCDEPIELNSTLIHYLNHTAGINTVGFWGYIWSSPTNNDIVNGNKTNWFNPKPRQKYNCNQRFSYSGGGYSILQDSIEKKENKSFDAIVHQELFKPLNLTHSTFVLTPQKSYVDGSIISVPITHLKYPQSAAAGLWSTTNEYALLLCEIFNASQNKGKLFAWNDIKKLMQTSQTIDGQTNNYGLGCFVEDDIIFHSGRTIGYTAFFEMSVKSGNGFVFMCNKHNINKTEVIDIVKTQIMDLLTYTS